MCDFEWIPRLGTPNFCPKCTSARWNGGGPPLKKRGRRFSKDVDKELIKEILVLHKNGLNGSGIEPPQRIIAKTLGISRSKVAGIIKSEVRVENEHEMDEFIELIFSSKYDLDLVEESPRMENVLESKLQERDLEIIFKKNKMDWSFRRIADHYNLDIDMVAEIYQREGGANVFENPFHIDLSGLSTKNDLTALGD